MTSPLRRKRPTTAPAPSTPARRAADLLALGALLLAAGTAPAQQYPTRAPVAVTLPPPPASATPVAQTPNATLWQPTVAPADPVQPAALQASGQAGGQPGGGRRQGPTQGGAGPGGTGGTPEAGAVPEQTIQLEPPGFERIFGRRDSEDQLKERIRQDKRNLGQYQDRVGFPDEPVLSKEPYYGRRWAPGHMLVEPNYLCYKRLLFEQKNMERYDWDLGPLGVLISPALFYADIVTLPYHLGTDPFRKCECNTGYCLPGDPVPLLLYPPDLSVTGTLAEAATVAALIAIFP